MMIIGIINITTAAAEEEERRSGGGQHHGLSIILVIALSGRAAIACQRAKGKIIINIRLAHGRVTDFSDSRADGWSARPAMHMLRLRAHPGESWAVMVLTVLASSSASAFEFEPGVNTTISAHFSRPLVL